MRRRTIIFTIFPINFALSIENLFVSNINKAKKKKNNLPSCKIIKLWFLKFPIYIKIILYNYKNNDDDGSGGGGAAAVDDDNKNGTCSTRNSVKNICPPSPMNTALFTTHSVRGINRESERNYP